MELGTTYGGPHRRRKFQMSAVWKKFCSKMVLETTYGSPYWRKKIQVPAVRKKFCSKIELGATYGAAHKRKEVPINKCNKGLAEERNSLKNNVLNTWKRAFKCGRLSKIFLRTGSLTSDVEVHIGNSVILMRVLYKNLLEKVSFKSKVILLLKKWWAALQTS